MRGVPHRRLTRAAAALLGVVFLLSGLSKASGTDAFETVIESYGLPSFAVLAPAIILYELALGLALLAGYRPKLCGVLALAGVTAFTTAFFYANVFHGVEDCGCFGDNPLLNSNPPLVYARNAALAALAAFLVWRGGKHGLTVRPWMARAFCLTLMAAAFWTGRTFRTPEAFAPRHPLFGKAVAETRLPQYVSLDKDSTYAVYVFSYDCPGCWDSMYNFMAYGRSHMADRLIGINVGGKGKRRFMECFKPDFPIIEAGKGFTDMVSVVPSFLYVRNGVVRDIIQGKAIHPEIFRHSYLEAR